MQLHCAGEMQATFCCASLTNFGQKDLHKALNWDNIWHFMESLQGFKKLI